MNLVLKSTLAVFSLVGLSQMAVASTIACFQSSDASLGVYGVLCY